MSVQYLAALADLRVTLARRKAIGNALSALHRLDEAPLRYGEPPLTAPSSSVIR